MSSPVAAEPDSTISPEKEETTADKPEQQEDSTATPEQQGEGSEQQEKSSEQQGEDSEQQGESTAKPEQQENTAEDAADTEKPPEAKKVSPLQEKIIRQVEFYFGDRNFPKDKFLQQAASSNSEGWVPVSTLLTFNRLKALSSDADFISSALNMTTTGVIEVSEDGASVRRPPDRPVPDVFAVDFRRGVRDRSVYTKGFPEDTKLDQIQEFMDQFGKVHYIQMRRTPQDKKFKGSIFAEFDRVEDAEQFVKKDSIQFNGTDLLREWKNDYFKRKQEERKQRKETKTGDSTTVQAKEDGEGEGEGKEEGEPASMVKVSGCVLQFTGVGKGKSREDIREDLLPFGTVAYVDFDRGKTEGYVRFREEGGAKRARDGLLERVVGAGGVAQLCGADTELRVLEGSEEEQYWCKVLESGSGRGRRGGRGGRRGGGGGGGGRGRGRGRGGGGGRGGGNFRKRKQRPSGGEEGENGPETKATKTED